MNKVEVLSPVGSYEGLLAAIHSNCDAVYLGGSRFSARAYAANFDSALLEQAVFYAHAHSKKVYYALNTLIKEKEFSIAYEDVKIAYLAGVDGIIVQDLGLSMMIRVCFPGLDLHASTQMTIHNLYGVKFLETLGYSRIVLSREISLEEIGLIKSQTQMALEVFVHGALCYSYSGQCLMSSLIGGRSGNRGHCAQTCRLPYEVVYKDKKGLKGYYLSPKDICSLELIPELIQAGVDSFKIEGRMKSEQYIGKVTELYKKYTELAISELKKNIAIKQGNHNDKDLKGYQVLDQDIEILNQLFNRGGFTTGYLTDALETTMISKDKPNHQGVLIGQIIKPVSGRKNYYVVDCYKEVGKGDTLLIQDALDRSFMISEALSIGQHNLFIKGKSVKGGTKIYRLTDLKLLNNISEDIAIKIEKPVANAKLIARIGEPLTLTLTHLMGEVCIKQEAVEPALKQPVSNEWLSEQLSKTGESIIDINKPVIETDEGIFVSMKQIKSIRREAIDALFKEIANPKANKRLSNFKSCEEPTADQIHIATDRTSKSQGSLTVLLRNRQQFEIINGYTVDSIYLDTMFLSADDVIYILQNTKQTEHKVYLKLPTIIRIKDVSYLKAYIELISSSSNANFKGFVVSSFDGLEFAKYYGKEIITDDGIWVMNKWTVKRLETIGVYKYQISPELSSNEIAELNSVKGILSIYGYQSVMTTAQCAFKEAFSCNHQSDNYELVDRLDNHIYVYKNCAYCTNIIFNAHPLYLLDRLDTIEDIGIHHFRIDFLSEGTDEIIKIMDAYFDRKGPLSIELDKYTRGHFERGVL